jgi:hypothetical protein
VLVSLPDTLPGKHNSFPLALLFQEGKTVSDKAPPPKPRPPCTKCRKRRLRVRGR